jgi:hypothetical protein
MFEFECLYMPAMKLLIIPAEDERQKEWDQIREKLKPEGFQLLPWPKAEIEKLRWMIIQKEADVSTKRTLSTPEMIADIQKYAEHSGRKEASFETDSTGEEV